MPMTTSRAFDSDVSLSMLPETKSPFASALRGALALPLLRRAIRESPDDFASNATIPNRSSSSSFADKLRRLVHIAR
jgi:hypothetical protein